MDTVLTKNQSKVLRDIPYKEPGAKGAGRLVITARYDDKCGNGYNTFSITGDIVSSNGRVIGGGCIHDLIADKCPKLVPLLKWHLTSTNGPTHYLANSLYFAKQGNLKGFRSSAVWLDADMDDMLNDDLDQVLIDRLPVLMDQFKQAMLDLGFVY